MFFTEIKSQSFDTNNPMDPTFQFFANGTNRENFPPPSRNISDSNDLTPGGSCALQQDFQFDKYSERKKISAALAKVTEFEEKLKFKSNDYLASRDDEIDKVSTWILNSIKYGSNGVLHMFGASGVGKTCVVRHIARKITTNSDYKHKLSPEVYITCNNMGNCVQLYDELLKLLIENKDSRKLKTFKPFYDHGGLAEVKRRFSLELSKREKHSICILDEVDFLIKSGNKNARNGGDLLRSLFDVASDNNSRLILIVISNNVSTIECDKDMAKTTLHFPVYSRMQLRELAEHRIGVSSKELEQLFGAHVMELLVRRSAKTGDCRHCFTQLKALFEQERQKLEKWLINFDSLEQDSDERTTSTLLNPDVCSNNESKQTSLLMPRLTRNDTSVSGDKMHRKVRKRSLWNHEMDAFHFSNGVKRPHDANDLDSLVVSLATLESQSSVKGILATPTEERSNSNTLSKDCSNKTPYSTFTESTIAPSPNASPFGTPSPKGPEPFREVVSFDCAIDPFIMDPNEVLDLRSGGKFGIDVAENNKKVRAFGQVLSPQTIAFSRERDIGLQENMHAQKENIAPVGSPIICDADGSLLAVETELQPLLGLSVMRQMVLFALLSWGIQQCKARNISMNAHDVFLSDCQLSSLQVVNLLQDVYQANQGSELLQLIKRDGSFLTSALEVFQDNKILKIHGNTARTPNQILPPRRMSHRQPSHSRTSKNGSIIIEFTIPLTKMYRVCSFLANKVETINCYEHFYRGHE